MRGQTIRAEFTVHPDKTIGGAFVGFGANMNPYLYCRPNWGEVNETNAADLRRKVIALAPQHVRIFFLNDWLTTGDTVVAKGDPRMYESFIRTVRLAQDAGATVNLTLWYDPNRWADPARYAQRFADALNYLINVEGLHAIQYVTLQNEPDGEVPLMQTKKITLPKYSAAYHAFAFREIFHPYHVKIIGGDLLSLHQAEWVKYLGPHVSDVLDGYSIHAYWNYWDTAKLQSRIAETVRQFSALPVSQQRPLYVTEFGARGAQPRAGLDPGLYFDNRRIADTNAQAMEISWFMLDAINHGFVGLVQWEMYDAGYDVFMHYGLIGRAKDGFPLKPAYFMMELLTHTCRPGWQTVRVTGDQSVRIAGNPEPITAAAMKSSSGDLTIWAVNHGGYRTLTTFDGFPSSKPIHIFFWNQNGNGRISSLIDVIRGKNGKVAVPIPAHAMVGITTLDPQF